MHAKRAKIAKVCKVSHAQKLAFAYANRSHGRRRRQKCARRVMHENLFSYMRTAATDAEGVKSVQGERLETRENSGCLRPMVNN